MGTPLHEWQEERTYNRLVDLVNQKPALEIVSPIAIKAEVYFQPFSDKPVLPLLWGEDGKLYRHNSNVKHWVKPFSQESALQSAYSREEVELILEHSKIQYQHDPKEIETKGYQARTLNLAKNVIPLHKRKHTNLEKKLTGTGN